MSQPAEPLSPRVEARWLPMRDGVRVAIDLILPPTDEEAPFPTVMMMTRYWRSFALRTPPPKGKAPLGPRASISDALVARGFAVVVVDARGTGASEGTWPYPWSAAELADYRRVVDWIVAQPWSNGRVGATGISYEGTTAMLLAASGHPAVKAVAPRSFELDLYTDIVRPGGVQNIAFVKAWGEAARVLDADRPPSLFGTIGRFTVKGARPVDEDAGGRELAEIVTARRNPDTLSALSDIEFRDDRYGDEQLTLGHLSVAAHLSRLEQAQVPAQVWGSWRDGTTADSALKLFALLPTVREVRIGAWTHTGGLHASPFREGQQPDPPLAAQWDAIMRFLEGPLRGSSPEAVAEPNTEERLIYYVTMGEEVWHATPTWPPEGVSNVIHYLEGGGQPTSTPSPGASVDRYRLDPRATTGTGNRWHTQLGRPVQYGNRAAADRSGQMAVWTGPVLTADVEISGSADVRVAVESRGTDLALFAYLEAVEPSGRVRMLTEGMLRAVHRAPRGLRTTYKREDAIPVQPEELMELRIRLLPTSVLVPRDWRLRLAIAGADAGTFAAPSTASDLDISIEYSHETPATLTLPIRAR